MKKIYAMYPLLLLLTLTFTNSCQKEELLMSESKISEQISHTWTMQLTTSESESTWKFKDGKIYLRQNENPKGEGNYRVECSLTKAKVIIDGFTGGNDFMNVTWQVIQLDSKILVVTNLNKGTQTYEFTRKD